MTMTAVPNGSGSAVTSTGQAAFPGFLATLPVRIPNARGVQYKMELNIIQAPNELKVTPTGFKVFGSKVNIWSLPDIERMVGGDEVVQFHNHPWDFYSTVMTGRLVETRAVWNAETGCLDTSVFVRDEGEEYFCGAEEFHLVTEVTPGTVTLMQMGQKMRRYIDKEGQTQLGEWGYMDRTGKRTTATGRDAAENPTFRAHLLELNPHLRVAAK